MITLPLPAKQTAALEKRRVLIVDDNWFFAACLRTTIDQEQDLIVCDTARSSANLLESIAHYKPDLLVMDLTLGTECGLELAHSLRQAGIRTPLLLVSSMAAPSRKELDRIGRCAFWCKGDAPKRFISRVRAVLSGFSTPPEPLTDTSAALQPVGSKSQ